MALEMWRGWGKHGVVAFGGRLGVFCTPQTPKRLIILLRLEVQVTIAAKIITKKLITKIFIRGNSYCNHYKTLCT